MGRSTQRLFDEYLAAAARAGDRAAFERLAARWQPKLAAHAYRLAGEPDLARDIAQDAWADITRGLSKLDDVRVFHAWAFRIVTRRAADAIRRRQRDRKLMDAYAADASRLDYEGAHNAPDSPNARLSAALNALPAPQRAAIALFYQQDLSVAEIAAALRIPAGTVKTRLMYARRKLRAALEGEESNG
ncbi:RNA polymerase sigma factor [Hyphococcus sp.]|uniref:RNA polymerase sigma factor n=1 Tax=Hyphococcus sp. TaxID=2038636 RepID=UPI003CCB900D